MSRRETAITWILAILVVAGWVWLTASQGALGLARNDDWSYLRNAFDLADSGRLAVTGWVQMTLIGQLVIAWPVIAVFGHSIAALQLLVAALGVVLIVTSYALARTIAPAWIAALAAGTVAIGPLLGTLAVSFMTDVPAAAFQLLTLWLGIRGIQRARPGWLVAAGITGLLAFAIREYAIVAIAAVWLIAIVVSTIRTSTAGRRAGQALHRGFLIGWTIALGLIGLVIVLWRGAQVTTTVNPLALNAQGLFSGSALPLTIGLLCLPALAFINPFAAVRRAWGASRWLTLVAALGLLIGLYVSRVRILGNYAAIEGGYSQVIRGLPTPLMPGWLWLLATLAALLAVISLLAVTVTAIATSAIARPAPFTGMRARAQAEPAVSLTVVFLVLTLALFLILPTVAHTALFDRYLLAAIPVITALALRSARLQGTLWRARWCPVPSVQVLVFALVSLAIVGGTAASDGARWAVAEQLAARFGIERGTIDAGFDWIGMHPDGTATVERAPTHWTWWTAGDADRPVCASLTFTDPGYDPQAAGPDAQTPVIGEVVIDLPLGGTRTLRIFGGPDNCAAVPR